MADRIMFFYCYWKLKKRINIRIHRDIEGPPKRSSGKQDVVGDCGHFVDMISEFEGIRRNYTDSREQQD